MIPRVPSRDLVADTNILLGTLMGNPDRAARLYRDIAARRTILISHGTAIEAKRVGLALEARRPGLGAAIDRVLDEIRVIEPDLYTHLLAPAGETLRLAVASANGSRSDDYVLALAWVTGADIWSHDRDFAGTGWPSWSTANLLGALAGVSRSSLSPAAPAG